MAVLLKIRQNRLRQFGLIKKKYDSEAVIVVMEMLKVREKNRIRSEKVEYVVVDR